MVFITKSYQDLFGVRSYINAFFKTDNKPLTLQKNNHGQFKLRCNR